MSFKKSILSIAVVAMLGSTAFAGSRFFDFDTNPENDGVLFGGTSTWRATGGLNDSGYLSVTDAVNGQRGAILIGDIDDGELVAGFNISADLRVGGGTERPADGFSFNFASFDDPTITNLVASISGEDVGPVSGYADVGNPGDADLPEEGTTTGIGIGFDEWFSGNHATDGSAGIDGGANSDALDDVVGLSVRVDNVVLEQAELPTLNGASDDVTSLQTGPDADSLDWANLTMNLDPDTQQLVVVWKDAVVFDEVIDWAPRAGALIFAGRTGGANSNHHIDNLLIETFQPSDDAPITTDFNGNGACDIGDIDALLYDGIPNNDAANFDLTGNGAADFADAEEWLRQCGSLPGDANLDGVNNAADLNAVGSNWQGDSITSWASGDFNGDGNTNASDLNTLGGLWNSTAAEWAASGAVAAHSTAAVPEPAGASLVMFALMGLGLLRRKN